MICPSCSKFAAFDTSGDPEVELEIDRVENEGAGDGEDAEAGMDKAADVRVYVAGTVRVCLTSECCADEMKESTFDVDAELELSRGEGCACDLSECTVSTSESLTDRSETEKVTIAKRGPNKGQEVRKPIPYRYQKRFYGAEVEIEVSCPCGKSSAESKWSDETPASGMDELV